MPQKGKLELEGKKWSCPEVSAGRNEFSGNGPVCRN